jgi:hypothetical protein
MVLLFQLSVIFFSICVEISCDMRNIYPPACDLANIYNGTWKYDHSVVIHNNPYHQCPNTMRKILQGYPKLKNQVKAYTCQNKTYQHAEYLPPSSDYPARSSGLRSSPPSHHCAILPLQLSLKLLSLRKMKIYFVGDSLMGQLFISFLCNMEQVFGTNHHIASEFFPELFLRPDVACESECISNSTFLELENEKGYHHRCFGCPDGVYHPLNDSFPYLSQFWPSKIRHDATHVVIGSGSWYAGYRDLLSPIEEYQRMLHTLRSTIWILLWRQDLGR